ncbi:MAG: polymorphic toxin type 8 domain-containing protein [Sulfuriferula sp.]
MNNLRRIILLIVIAILSSQSLADNYGSNNTYSGNSSYNRQSNSSYNNHGNNSNNNNNSSNLNSHGFPFAVGNRHNRDYFSQKSSQSDDPNQYNRDHHRDLKQYSAYPTSSQNTYYGNKVDSRLNPELLRNTLRYWPVKKGDNFPPAATVNRNFRPTEGGIVNATKITDRKQPGYAFNQGYTREADRQARLRELVNDPKLGRADRGWIKQEINRVELKDPRNAQLNIAGKRKALNGKTKLRNPPGMQLAHARGNEHHKGYSYSYAAMQHTDLHLLQHKYDNFGTANPERVPAGYSSAISPSANTSAAKQ